jgi:hypothetical protein
MEAEEDGPDVLQGGKQLGWVRAQSLDQAIAKFRPLGVFLPLDASKGDFHHLVEIEIAGDGVELAGI